MLSCRAWGQRKSERKVTKRKEETREETTIEKQNKEGKTGQKTEREKEKFPGSGELRLLWNHLNSEHFWIHFIWKKRGGWCYTLISAGRNATQQRSRHPLEEKAVHAWLWRSFLSLFNYWRSQLHNNSWPLSFCRHNKHSVTSCWESRQEFFTYPRIFRHFSAFLFHFNILI